MGFCGYSSNNLFTVIVLNLTWKSHIVMLIFFYTFFMNHKSACNPHISLWMITITLHRIYSCMVNSSLTVLLYGCSVYTATICSWYYYSCMSTSSTCFHNVIAFDSCFDIWPSNDILFDDILYTCFMTLFMIIDGKVSGIIVTHAATMHVAT